MTHRVHHVIASMDTMHSFASLASSLIIIGAAAISGPCDIFGAAGTPCVAAHSTVRALYGAYAGALYEVCVCNLCVRHVYWF